MPRPSRTLVLSVSAFAFAAVACGGAPEGAIEAEGLECPPESDCYDPPAAVGEGGAIYFDATEFEFVNFRGLPVEGDVEVTLNNIGTAEHNIVFEGANEGSVSADDMLVAPGEQVTGTFNLFATDYVYFCTVPGHRQAGMEGVLTVYSTAEQAKEALGEQAEIPTDGGTETGTEEPSPTATDTDA